MTTAETHLWDAPHPYYCAPGNFYASPDKGCHVEYDSWESFADPTEGLTMNQQFLEGLGNGLYDGDPDYHVLWRWDWVKPDPDDYSPEDGEEVPDYDELRLFYMLQRKAKNISVTVYVTDVDELKVKEWLTGKAEYMRKMWSPFL